MLSKRLKKVLDYIEISDCVADIGCDHGYLALSALKKGVKMVQLVDNKENPLSSAIKNLESWPNKKQILFTMADGISMIDDDIDVVCICGMGPDTIIEIINNSLSRACLLKKLIIQPNNKADCLREFLNNHNFMIIDESMVFEKGKFYPIIVTKYVDNYLPLSAKEIKYGPIFLNKKEKIYLDYLNTQLININNILNGNLNKNIYQSFMNEKKEIEEIINNEDYKNN